LVGLQHKRIPLASEDLEAINGELPRADTV
jgi:hypothetical protein